MAGNENAFFVSFFGRDAGQNVEGSDSSFFGADAGKNTTIGGNSFFGRLPEFRARGLAIAITSQSVHEAGKASGLKRTILHATPLARSFSNRWIPRGGDVSNA